MAKFRLQDSFVLFDLFGFFGSRRADATPVLGDPVVDGRIAEAVEVADRRRGEIGGGDSGFTNG